MSKFSSENTPLPSNIGNVNTSKETINAQYYRSTSSDSGYKLTVNANTQQILPINVYNIQQCVLGLCLFINGNEIKFLKNALYEHTIYIKIHSTAPVNGIAAVDIIDKNGNSFSANTLSTKNVTSVDSDFTIISVMIKHEINDTCRLRFGGGEVPVISSNLTNSGIWANQNYVVDNFVRWVDATNIDGFYRCKIDTTTNQPPSDTTYWERIANAPGSDIELNIVSIAWKIIEK